MKYTMPFAFIFTLGLLGLNAPMAEAHHNSPMYDMIEEIENFDYMDMHEAAIDNLTDNSNMDTAQRVDEIASGANDTAM